MILKVFIYLLVKPTKTWPTNKYNLTGVEEFISGIMLYMLQIIILLENFFITDKLSSYFLLTSSVL